jgi:hypothetical protein
MIPHTNHSPRNKFLIYWTESNSWIYFIYLYIYMYFLHFSIFYFSKILDPPSTNLDILICPSRYWNSDLYWFKSSTNRNSKVTTTAGHSFYIGPIGSFYNQVNDTGSWEPLVFVGYQISWFSYQIIHKDLHVDYNPLKGMLLLISLLKLSTVPYAAGTKVGVTRGQREKILTTSGNKIYFKTIH